MGLDTSAGNLGWDFVPGTKGCGKIRGGESMNDGELVCRFKPRKFLIC